MKRNKIIKHYKSFFGLEDTGLGEDDHLMIDWAESLVKDCNLHIVSNRRELLIAYGEWIHELAGCKDTEKATTLADIYLSNL